MVERLPKEIVELLSDPLVRKALVDQLKEEGKFFRDQEEDQAFLESSKVDGSTGLDFPDPELEQRKSDFLNKLRRMKRDGNYRNKSSS